MTLLRHLMRGEKIGMSDMSVVLYDDRDHLDCDETTSCCKTLSRIAADFHVLVVLQE